MYLQKLLCNFRITVVLSARRDYIVKNSEILMGKSFPFGYNNI